MPDDINKLYDDEEETDLSQYDKNVLLQAEVERLEESNRKLRKICQNWLGEVIALRSEKKKLVGLIAELLADREANTNADALRRF